MADKKEIYTKKDDGSLQFVGYLPTEDVVGYSEYSEKIADIITQLGGKANAFGVAGDGLSFNNNTITIDTDVMATRAESNIAYVHAGALRYSEINTSYIGSVEGGTGSSPYGNYWDALIRIEHRNGESDGSHYVTEIITNLVNHGDLYWRKTVANPNGWGAWKTILDSSNLDSFLTKQRLTSDLGFGSYQPNIFWGSLASGYTPVWGSDNLYGGGIHFAEKDGQTSMQIDGTFRQREGMCEVIDTSTIGSQRVDYANSAGNAASAGRATICESTALLKAEGENLGAKIQSQHTSGSIGNVTYNQDTWYVLGNDGDTYNLAEMVTTDTFNSKLTDALKTINVEYSTRSGVTSMLDNGNYTSSSLPLTYDSNNTTGLTYESWPKLTIESNTGFGILRGGVDGKGAFQIACGVDGHNLFYRYVKDNASPYGWVRLLTKSNLSVVDNLTDTSAEAVLSANQGRILNNKFSNYQPLLGSGTGATMQWLSFKNGSSYSISGIWCKKVEMTVEGSVGNQANVYFTVDTYYQSTFSNGTWYFVAMPSSGGYINTLSWGLETNSSNTGGTLYALRVYSGSKTTYKFNIIGIRFF